MTTVEITQTEEISEAGKNGGGKSVLLSNGNERIRGSINIK